MRCLLVLACLGAAPLPLGGQQHPSPYVAERHRAIKALSADEVTGYLAGDGMGFALAAELNHYPGPRHVLALGDSLALSTEQRQAVDGIYQRMRADAAALGRELVAGERALDRLFAAGAIADADVERLVGEIATIRGRIRATHLRAHLATRRLLSDGQRARYDALRGYPAATPEHGRHH